MQQGGYSKALEEENDVIKWAMWCLGNSNLVVVCRIYPGRGVSVSVGGEGNQENELIGPHTDLGP